MAESELQRVQEDLAIIRNAAGAELLFGWEDVYITFASAALTAIAFVWAIIPHGLPLYWGWLPVLVVTIPWLGWVRYRYRRAAGRSAIRRREYSLTIVLTVLFLAIAVVYRVWAVRLGLPFRVVQATAFVMTGFALAAFSMVDKRRVSAIPMALAAMLAGLVLPRVHMPAAAVFALAVTLAAPVCGYIQVRQLRKAERSHAAD